LTLTLTLTAVALKNSVVGNNDAMSAFRCFRADLDSKQT